MADDRRSRSSAFSITLFYVYPINGVLFLQAGGNLSAEEVQALVGDGSGPIGFASR